MGETKECLDERHAEVEGLAEKLAVVVGLEFCGVHERVDRWLWRLLGHWIHRVRSIHRLYRLLGVAVGLRIRNWRKVHSCCCCYVVLYSK